MWIIDIYKNRKVKNKCIWTIIIFILPVLLVFSPYLFSRYDNIISYNTEIYISLFCAALWSFLGPLLINSYFENMVYFINLVENSFFSTNDVIQDEENLKGDVYELYSLEIRKFKRRQKVFFVGWVGLILTILLCSTEQLKAFSFYGFSDIYYWLLLVYIAFIAYLQSIGFSALIMSISIIKNCLKHNELLENILEFNFGTGINEFGKVVTHTTMCFFSGILYFPILIVYAKETSDVLTFGIYTLMMIFIISLVVCFISACLIIRKNAKAQRESLIDEFRQIYNKKMKISIANYDNNHTIDDVVRELQVHNIYNHIQELERININPVKLDKITATVFTIIFPALFFVNDMIGLYNSLFLWFKT